MISCAPRRYYMHYTVAWEKSVPRATSSPRVFGDLVWCPRTATTCHIMRISFPPRRSFMHEGGYSLLFLRPLSGRGGASTACTGPRASWRRARVPSCSTVYHTTVSVRLRCAGKFEGGLPLNVWHLWCPNRRSVVFPPKFATSVPARCPRPFLPRRFIGRWHFGRAVAIAYGLRSRQMRCRWKALEKLGFPTFAIFWISLF